MASPSWKELATQKKAQQQASIPKEWLLPDPPPRDQLDISSIPESCGLLSDLEITITNTPVEGLLPKLASGEWSAVVVTTAFYKRAIIAHQLTNCLTEVFVEKALARAKDLDEHLAKTGTPVGPLHGLPVSLKDQINIEGMESTMGYISWIGINAKENAVLVDILNNLGAIPFVKTNVPQTLMWPETFNHIFGRTVNPYNRSLTSGGSSGGEGALVALKGSPIGVGSDIGGSIRIPSGFCGVYGLRPSYGRVPYGGCVNSLLGQDSVPSVLGPLAGSIAGIKSFMQGVISQKPWLIDPLSPRKAWDEDGYQLADHGNGKNLVFAILQHDEHVLPHPPVLRALEITKKALEKAGHKVVEWKPYKHKEIYDTLRGIWGAGAAEDFATVAAISGEPVIESMEPSEEEVAAIEAGFRPDSNGVTAYKVWQVQKRKAELRREYLKYWNDTASTTGTGRPVDAIISPMASYAAPPHGLNKNANYTLVWNGLDYSALVIPVTRVDQQLDVKKDPHKFFSREDETNYELYDPKTFANAPISIQVVGRTMEEEAVIAMSEVVDAALKSL